MADKAFELPFYDSKLKEWLVRCKVEPSEVNVEALAQLLGKEIQEVVASVIRYLIMPFRHASRSSTKSNKKPKGRTIQATDVLVAMQTVHGGNVPIPLLQGKTVMHLVLPKSSFNRAIRELGSMMIEAPGNRDEMPRLRWGLEALAMIQREVEWYVRTQVDKARAQSKRYYNDKTYAYSIKVRPRSKSRSSTTNKKSGKRKTRGRSKAKDNLPTSNVYRYLK